MVRAGDGRSPPSDLSADELEQYKRVRSLLSCSSVRSLISWRTNLSRALYGEYPLPVVSATPESVDSLTSAMLADWHENVTAPQNTILAISGRRARHNVDPQAAPMAGGVATFKSVCNFPCRPAACRKREVFLVDRPGSVQTTL